MRLRWFERVVGLALLMKYKPLLRVSAAENQWVRSVIVEEHLVAARAPQAFLVIEDVCEGNFSFGKRRDCCDSAPDPNSLTGPTSPLVISMSHLAQTWSSSAIETLFSVISA